MVLGERRAAFPSCTDMGGNAQAQPCSFRWKELEEEMARPLEGMLVVSVEQAVAAPLCSCRLADAGARVIKIERPEGDFARGYDRAAHGQSSYFVWLNRGKESVVLDIKNPDDRDLLTRLISRADVLVQNLMPGAMARAGFNLEELRRRRPRLVICSISGYGETGPYRAMKSYDMLIQAETGLASLTGPAQAPGRVGASVTDIAAGLNAYAAILEALIARQRTGDGALIRVSLFDATAEWMAVPLIHFDYGGRAPERMGLAHPSVAPYGVFATGDGKEILIAIQNEREWRRFCAEILKRCRPRRRPALQRQQPAGHAPRRGRRVGRRRVRPLFAQPRSPSG